MECDQRQWAQADPIVCFYLALLCFITARQDERESGASFQLVLLTVRMDYETEQPSCEMQMKLNGEVVPNAGRALQQTFHHEAPGSHQTVLISTRPLYKSPSGSTVLEWKILMKSTRVAEPQRLSWSFTAYRPHRAHVQTLDVEGKRHDWGTFGLKADGGERPQLVVRLGSNVRVAGDFEQTEYDPGQERE